MVVLVLLFICGVPIFKQHQKTVSQTGFRHLQHLFIHFGISSMNKMKKVPQTQINKGICRMKFYIFIKYLEISIYCGNVELHSFP